VKDIYDIIDEFRKRPVEPFALATLVRANGSSYRRPGARLLICQDGGMIGSLSGGCIEDEIAERAKAVLQSGQPVVMSFDTRRRFGCHGKIDILIERVKSSFFAGLARYVDERRSCVVITTSEGSSVMSPPDDGSKLPNEQGAAVSLKEWEANSFPCSPLIQEVHPRIRLLIFGEGPDSRPLCEFCHLLGWEPLEIRDATALPSDPDRWTAAIVKSHNYGRDFATLAKLLPLNLRYVGLIGPKKRRDQLLNDLLEIGVAMNAGFFAPAGLDLNAETPEEIALAVVSEISLVFAEASGQSLRDRKLPIHSAMNVAGLQPTPGWQTSAP
jgi:xanthine dehydrogenase accessory factor